MTLALAVLRIDAKPSDEASAVIGFEPRHDVTTMVSWVRST
jgi:hypothetical protein